MLAIIGSIIGFLISFAPELLKIIRDKKDKEHELKIIGLQIEAMKLKQYSKLEEVQHYNQLEESKYLLPVQTMKFKAVEVISSLVRPIVTYATFFMYCSLKIFVVYFCLNIIGCTNLDLISKIWTEEDWALFFGVTTFWFGSRSINKARQ